DFARLGLELDPGFLAVRVPEGRVDLAGRGVGRAVDRGRAALGVDALDRVLRLAVDLSRVTVDGDGYLLPVVEPDQGARGLPRRPIGGRDLDLAGGLVDLDLEPVEVRLARRDVAVDLERPGRRVDLVLDAVDREARRGAVGVKHHRGPGAV